ncbi:MAG: hypothetical protein AB8G18_00315 [Gammaproteobacteria bacterium]
MKNKIKNPLLAATLLLLSGALLSQSANALSFNLSFDDIALGETVGSGVFSFDEDLSDGSYTLDSLTNVIFDVSFINGESFELIDTEDLLNEVLAVITTENGIQRLRFGNVNGNSGGNINGSFDFFNGTGSNLSFEPGVDGGDFYGTSDFFGNYSAVTIPVPPAIFFLMSGLLTFAFGKSGRETASAT